MTVHFLEVPYLNGEVEVEFDYYKGWAGNREEPPEPEDIEIIKVMFEGINVTDIVDLDSIQDTLTDLIHELQRQKEYDED